MRWIIVTAALAMALHASAGGVVLERAYWAPDRGAPYQWFEGAKDLQSFFTTDYRAAGFVYAYLRNGADRSLSCSALQLNGRPAEDLRQERAVIWWRMLPDPLPVGAVGEVMVRLRNPLQEPTRLSLDLQGRSLETTIAPQPNPLRIETVGFKPERDLIFLVVEALDGKRHRLTKVLLDGQDVTAQAKLLDPSFARGIAPVSLRPKQALVEGSYHVYEVTAEGGEAAACCVRTYDGWVPLGTYGYGEYEEFARNGCNGHANFGRHSAEDLASQATLLMRGVSLVGGDPPAPYMGRNPGLWAYYLADEPDCMDYGVKDVPEPQRIGFHAMEMERRARVCREADPTKPTFLTIDLTYKPANFYIYGPLADITNVDCYTRAIGADLKMVREVVETARLGAGPHPLAFTFEGYFPDPDNRDELAKRRFPRPPLAEEMRLAIYYALGSGARGLYDYIHCTEKSGNLTSRGTKDYPDLWREIGRAYREIDTVAPLVALAHPTQLATSADPKLRLMTLVTGDDALLIIAANEDYSEEATAFRYRPREDAVIRLPVIPWLLPRKAWRIAEDGLQPLELQVHAQATEIRLGRLEVAGMVLVTSDPSLGERLTQRLRERDAARAATLLREWRRRQDAEAAYWHTVRRLTGEFADRMVLGAPINAYGMQLPRFWNPAQEQYWALEFGVNDAQEGPDQGAEWILKIPPEAAGKPHSIYAVCGAWGRPAQFLLRSPTGEDLLKQEITGDFSGRLVRLRVTFPTAGEYKLRYLLPGPGPKGGRVAHAVYVIPDGLEPPEVP